MTRVTPACTAGSQSLPRWRDRIAQLVNQQHDIHEDPNMPSRAGPGRARLGARPAGLGCRVQAEPPRLSPSASVNPFVGTAGHGHTYPGATVPFGLVQLSPDTRTEGWDGCSGYHYDDTTIQGFSHTHLTGTGAADLGDVLLMPTVGDVHLDVGTPGNGYVSRFSHARETAHPGYYRVFLDDPKVTAELTATARAGFHRYTFPATDSAHVVLDLVHGIGCSVYEAGLTVEGSDTISGYRKTHGWAGDRSVYFVLQFSRPFDAAGIEQDGARLAPGSARREGRASQSVRELQDDGGRGHPGQSRHFRDGHRRRAQEPGRRDPRLGLRRRPQAGRRPSGTRTLGTSRHRDARPARPRDLLLQPVPVVAGPDPVQRRRRDLPGHGPQEPRRGRLPELHRDVALGHVPGRKPPADARSAGPRERHRPHHDGRVRRAGPARPAGLAALGQRDLVHDRLPLDPGHHRRLLQRLPGLRRRGRLPGHARHGHAGPQRPGRLQDAGLCRLAPGAAGDLLDVGIRLRRLVPRAHGRRAGPQGRRPAVLRARRELPQRVRRHDRLHARAQGATARGGRRSPPTRWSTTSTPRRTPGSTPSRSSRTCRA